MKSANDETNYLPIGKIQVRTCGRIDLVNMNNIVHCEANNNYTILHIFDNRKICVSRTIKKLESVLPHPQFIRVHQSHLVNTAYIKQVVRSEASVVLTDNSRIPVSSRKWEQIDNFLNMLPSI